MNLKFFKNNNQLFYYSVILITILFSTSPLKAQVTIGKDSIPHNFSILELRTDNKKGGLRLPQLTTMQRENLITGLSSSDATAAKGLVVYDTELNCLEFWNGSGWISLCYDTQPVIACTPAPSEISGPSTIGSSITETYSINSMSDVTYNWTVSGCVSLATGQGSNSITATAVGAIGAPGRISVKVTAINGSCTGTSTLDVKVGCGAYVSPGRMERIYVL